MQYPLPDGLSPMQKWLMLKDLETLIKQELEAIKDEVFNEVDAGNADGQVTKVSKVTVKPKDSILQFLQDRDLLRLVKKDEIDMKKVSQLVEAGIIGEDELEEHLDVKETSYLKKNKK